MGQLHAALVVSVLTPEYPDGGVCQQTFGHDARWLATTQQHAQHRLEALQGRLPAAWVAAVAAAAAQASEAAADMETALGANVSWKLGDTVSTLDGLTVKLAAALHPVQAGWRTERAARFSAFAALATQGSGPPAAAAAGAAEVLVLLGRLWRLKWDNHPMEVFWRRAALRTWTPTISATTCGPSRRRCPRGAAVRSSRRSSWSDGERGRGRASGKLRGGECQWYIQSIAVVHFLTVFSSAFL